MAVRVRWPMASRERGRSRWCASSLGGGNGTGQARVGNVRFGVNPAGRLEERPSRCRLLGRELAGTAGGRSAPGSAWPSSRGSGPLIGRLRTPLTTHAVAGGFGLPVSGPSFARSNGCTPRPWNSRSSCAGTPAASNCPSRCASCTRPGRAFTSEATARCGLPGEYLPGQPGEDRLRADLDEHPRAGGVHRLDLVGEPHRRDEVLGQLPGDRGGFGRVRRGGGVRVHRLPRRGERRLRRARPPSGSFAPAMSGEWNPHATGMRCAADLRGLQLLGGRP